MKSQLKMIAAATFLSLRCVNMRKFGIRKTAFVYGAIKGSCAIGIVLAALSGLAHALRARPTCHRKAALG